MKQIQAVLLNCPSVLLNSFTYNTLMYLLMRIKLHFPFICIYKFCFHDINLIFSVAIVLVNFSLFKFFIYGAIINVCDHQYGELIVCVFRVIIYVDKHKQLQLVLQKQKTHILNQQIMDILLVQGSSTYILLQLDIFMLNQDKYMM